MSIDKLVRWVASDICGRDELVLKIRLKKGDLENIGQEVVNK